MQATLSLGSKSFPSRPARTLEKSKRSNLPALVTHERHKQLSQKQSIACHCVPEEDKESKIEPNKETFVAHASRVGRMVVPGTTLERDRKVGKDA
jgi:hypothetical protein